LVFFFQQAHTQNT